MDTATITDVATATAALNKIRDDLSKAVITAAEASANLRETVIDVRPKGTLTVAEMAEAVGRDRNFIDSVWSAHGDTVKGRQTRKPVDALNGSGVDDAQRLAHAATARRQALAAVTTLRAERDRTVAMVYAGKILGPSAIAAAVGIDRNHALRTARKLGVKAAWRSADSVRNQYSSRA